MTCLQNRKPTFSPTALISLWSGQTHRHFHKGEAPSNWMVQRKQLLFFQPALSPRSSHRMHTVPYNEAHHSGLQAAHGMHVCLFCSSWKQHDESSSGGHKHCSVYVQQAFVEWINELELHIKHSDPINTNTPASLSSKSSWVPLTHHLIYPRLSTWWPCLSTGLLFPVFGYFLLY